MEKWCVLVLILTRSLFAQEGDIFEVYYSKVKGGEITASNAFSHLDELEGKLFRDANRFLDELTIVDAEVNFISPKDNLSEISAKWRSHYQNTEMDKLLKKAMRDPHAILDSPESIKTLKDNRKFSHIMRSNFLRV